ncbi:hypothetical protein B0T21DRAFT_371408 [Apiosordaria backusii]|uniref:Kinase n=1 Tax=Apiosordaria backusii TaxID=314023 RepID=A0AA40B2A6_9PEZI|nr:hypothetical protein B0T21DRAFT_371408 [Apiosordaria backusii]
MISNREIPKHADLQPYNFAVAGHDGTLCDPEGELFIKPCVQQEIDFYEKAFKDHPAFADLMPEYLGTLVLNDASDVHDIEEQIPAAVEHMTQHFKEEAVRMAKQHVADVAAAEAAKAAAETQPKDNIKWKPNKSRKIATDKSVVLENAAYGFKRPNILDAKLGQRLWADDAPLEKRQRFDEITKVTTNGSHGFRIAGMRVYKGGDNPEEWDQEGYKVYNKDHGRLVVNKDNIVQEIGKFIFNPRANIDEDLGRAVAEAFVNDLKRVEQVLASSETRMYSASLLFTFEGDGDALREAIEQQTPTTPPKEATKKEPIPLASRVDSGIVMDGDGEIILPTGHGAGLNGVIEGDVKVLELAGDDEDDDEDFASLPKIYSLKLIDFAHATWVPGQGPDENSLFGVRSLIKIFEELAE